MAVSIGTSRAEAWKSAGLGVELLMRPATSIEIAAAGAQAKSRIRDALAGVDALADLGIATPAAEALDDVYYITGLTQWLMACALGAMVVSDWRGVVDEKTGAAAPLTQENLADLMLVEPVQAAFEGHVYSIAARVIAEGKGSPPPQNGSAAGAANIAGDAGKPETPVPPETETAPSMQRPR